LDKNEDSFQFDYKLDEQIDKIFLQKEVLSCLKKLSFKYREVITLFYFEHLSYEQISEILHIPKSTVGVRISRAKSMLKKLCNNVRGR
jgi:RNA polymerase sigma-70 factor (ECF subfamily)